MLKLVKTIDGIMFKARSTDVSMIYGTTTSPSYRNLGLNSFTMKEVVDFTSSSDKIAKAIIICLTSNILSSKPPSALWEDKEVPSIEIDRRLCYTLKALQTS